MDWAPLERELAAWKAAGRVATLWWRDDDATAPTPELERLLRLRAEVGLPIALAVVPLASGAALAERLAAEEGHAVLQHGLAHVNRAAPGEKKRELAGRPAGQTAVALAAARERLAGLFGARALPVLVPPWNRIAAELVSALPTAGLTGLSTFGPRRRRQAADGVLQANAHVDPIDWRGTRGFAGADRVIRELAEHLAARRLGHVDTDEPTGLLTHHLAQDEPAWAFLDELLRRTAAQPACRWLGADEIFGAADDG